MGTPREESHEMPPRLLRRMERELPRAPAMTTTQILSGALVEPQRALPAAVERRSALVPILVATVAGLALAAIVASRADFKGAVLQRLSSDPKVDQISPHDLSEKVEQGRKLAV